MKRLFASYTSAFVHLNPERIKLGLATILQIDEQLGHPSRHFSSIHVAGTNGKGSVSTKIAHALMYAGKRVGLYTSPHVLSFCERIWVGGSLISEERMRAYLYQVEGAAKKVGVEPTFFELLTLIAFLHFSHEKVEVALIEVGMGGRLDATNIILPELSVITSISYDHREYLGNSLEEIAFEKGGIIKAAIPLVLGGGIAPLSVLENIATERGSPFFIAEVEEDFELQNQKTASLALDHLRMEIPLEARERGLQVRPPCRFERIREEPPVILDVAHNEAGLEALFKKIEQHFPGSLITVVAAFSCPHKAPIMARIIKERAHFVYLTEANHERATPPPYVEGCFVEKDVRRALLLAEKTLAQRGGVLLVTGTFFMMAEVLDFFGLKEVRGPLCD